MLWNGNETLYMAVREPNGYIGEIKNTMWSVWPTWESWTWRGWEGKPVEVEVYTKQPEVSLYLNGKLLETKKVSRETQFKAVFTVNYTPGTLRAEAGGKSVTLSTAGEPAKLRLTTDRKTIKSGGQDLAFVTVEVLDKAGNICPEAAIPCNVTVTGGATLMAAASADLKDTEPYTSPRVTTWKGRAIIVIRSGNKAGTAKVSVKGGKLAGMASVRVE
jgi:beta-galactosidase